MYSRWLSRQYNSSMYGKLANCFIDDPSRFSDSARVNAHSHTPTADIRDIWLIKTVRSYERVWRLQSLDALQLFLIVLLVAIGSTDTRRAVCVQCRWCIDVERTVLIHVRYDAIRPNVAY